MILRKRAPRTLHRAVVKDAFRQAWNEKRLWPLALLAGVLQTGGVFDLLASWFERLNDPSSSNLTATLAFLNRLISSARLPSGLSLAQLLAWLDRIQGLLIVLIVFAAIFAFSVLCQGALLLALAPNKRVTRPKLSELFSRAGKFLRPLAIIDLLAFLVIAIVWTIALSLISLLPDGILWSAIVEILGSLFLMVCALAITCLHMFGALAVAHEGETVHEALGRAVAMFVGSWLPALEASAVLFILNVVLTFAAFGLASIAVIPLRFLALAALILKFDALISSLTVANVALFILVGLLGGAYFITFQYAAWSSLYRRIGERTAVARTTRWLNWLTAK